MNPSITVTQKQLSEILLSVAVVRPVFIWGLRVSGNRRWFNNLRIGLGCPVCSGSANYLEPRPYGVYLRTLQ
jgi:hypothetical protein